MVRCSQPTVARLPKQVGKIGEVELADDLSYGNPKWGTLVDPHFLWLVTFCLSSGEFCSVVHWQCERNEGEYPTKIVNIHQSVDVF